MAFGDRLRELRRSKNMTQKELSKALFISERVISYYEKNERFPNDAMTLIRIAEYFGVSIDYLLEMPNREKEAPLNCSGYTQDLMQLIQLYNAADMYEKGRILQFAIDLNDKDLHKK